MIKGKSTKPASAIYVDYYEKIVFENNLINARNHKLGGFVRGSDLTINNNKYKKKNKSKEYDIFLSQGL